MSSRGTKDYGQLQYIHAMDYYAAIKRPISDNRTILNTSDKDMLSKRIRHKRLILFLLSSRTGKTNLRGKYQNCGYVGAEALTGKFLLRNVLYILTECELHKVSYC